MIRNKSIGDLGRLHTHERWERFVSDRSMMNPQGKSQQVKKIVILRTKEENPLTKFISITNQFLLGLNSFIKSNY